MDEYKSKSGSYQGLYYMNIKHSLGDIIEFYQRNPELLTDESKRKAFFMALEIFSLHET
jgi:hypothetical protein